MTSVAVIGAGRLGSTLGYSLSQKEYPVKALCCRRASSAEESRQIIGQGASSTDIIQTAGQGQIIILAVPDDVIEPTALKLAAADIDWSDRTVFHCSGLLPAQILSPLKRCGALTASFHPVQTFPQKERHSGLFRGIYFGLEGDEEAVKTAKQMARALGAETVRLDAEDKAFFHAACSIASNHLAALLGMASSQMEKAGFSRELSLKIVFPLIQRTLQNVKKLGASNALTGPVIRGDKKTLISHLNSLKEAPHYSDSYKSLARLILHTAEREKRLPSEMIRDLRELLEDK